MKQIHRQHSKSVVFIGKFSTKVKSKFSTKIKFVNKLIVGKFTNGFFEFVDNYT